MTAYQSTIMQHHGDDDTGACPVCAFLDGDRSPGVMLRVIDALDYILAENEKIMSDAIIQIDDLLDEAEQ